MSRYTRKSGGSGVTSVASTTTSWRVASAAACSRQNRPNTGSSGHGYHLGTTRTRISGRSLRTVASVRCAWSVRT